MPIICLSNFPKELIKYHRGIGYICDGLDKSPIKIGSIVRKINSEEGDITQNGTEGTIIGSLSVCIEGIYGYTVIWDNEEDVPVNVVSSKIEFVNDKKLAGLKEIDEAKWEKDKFGCYNLYVKDREGRKVHCWLSLRPVYCDRGHIQLMIDGFFLYLDHSDSFPRFFFNFEEADNHTRLFLKWRLWKHRVFEHKIK